MRNKLLLSLLLVVVCRQPGFSQARHVILISIDGLRPEMYLDSTWPAPNLRQLMRRGTYADHMRSVFPAYTYPSHTAMVTGALPARSGIYFNQSKTGNGEWDWFATSIRVPTLWRALRQAGMTTSAIQWPLSAMDTITYSVPEIFDIRHPEDRITLTRKYATPGLLDELERNATGRLDSSTMTEEYFSIDDQSARMAAYIIATRKPAFLAIHLPSVDGKEHEQGPDGDSVRLALAASDHDVGLILEGIQRSGAKDSTVVIIVGDHGMSEIHEAFRPNLLIKALPVKFTAAGGSAFLYYKPSESDLPLMETGLRTAKSWAEQIVKNIGKKNPGLTDFKGYQPRNFQEESTLQTIIEYWPRYGSWGKLHATGLSNIEISNQPYSSKAILKAVADSLNQLPADERKLFRIVDRKELDRMGADSAAILALAATPGLVFSGAVKPAGAVNNGPGTAIQQNPLEGIFYPVHGGHHGYDPELLCMYTGFIAAGTGIRKGGHINDLCVTDIAPLVAKLLGVKFAAPDGKLVPGILAGPGSTLAGPDWPNLHRYQEDNEKLKTEAVPSDRVVFLGNSITDFWIRSSPAFFSEHHFIDRGISGQTSPQMLLRFRPDIIDLHPRAVVILAGTNDIAGNTGPATLEMIEDNIQSMAELAKSNKIKVLLCSITPASGFDKRPPQKIDSLNAWLREYAAKNDLPYVDYYSALVDPDKGFKKEYSNDGLHPNPAGYAVMENIILPIIQKVIRKHS
jgi:lysophospholipase L1-like esterase